MHDNLYLHRDLGKDPRGRSDVEWESTELISLSVILETQILLVYLMDGNVEISIHQFDGYNPGPSGK